MGLGLLYHWLCILTTHLIDRDCCRYPAVSSLFKVVQVPLCPRENGMFARIQGRNPFVRNIYKRRTGKLWESFSGQRYFIILLLFLQQYPRSPSMDRIYIEIFSIICYNIYSSFIPHKHINRTAPYRSYAVIWCFFVPFNTKKRHEDQPHVYYQFVTLSNISSCNSSTANAFFRVVIR